MYICIYTHTHTQKCVHIYICIYIYICALYICTYTHACVRLSLPVLHVNRCHVLLHIVRESACSHACSSRCFYCRLVSPVHFERDGRWARGTIENVKQIEHPQIINCARIYLQDDILLLDFSRWKYTCLFCSLCLLYFVFKSRENRLQYGFFLLNFSHREHICISMY